MEMLVDLICLLALCDKSDCTQGHTNNKYLSITPFIPILIRVLGANAADGTAELRTKAYRAIDVILKHHTGDTPQIVVDLLFRGIADEDRSVRISAG